MTARPYDAATARFLTPDPLQEDYTPFSPYLYCMANPMNYTDPTGLSTYVTILEDGTYRVEDGKLDDDLNIYLSTRDADGNLIVSNESIGITITPTSFYNSDIGKWAEGAIINPADNSGISFLNSLIQNPIGNIEYGSNAYNGQIYDFKTTNGTMDTSDDARVPLDHYRGMPIPTSSENNTPIYTSARDIGNIAAGFVSGYNKVPWRIARLTFDGLESIQKRQFTSEGESSQNAQKFGYEWGKCYRQMK